MTDTIYTRQLPLLLWGLIVLGLLASISMTAFVGWYQNQFDDKRAALQSAQQDLTLEREKLRRLLVETRTETEELLLSKQPLIAPRESASLQVLQQQVNTLTEHYPIPELQQVTEVLRQQTVLNQSFWNEAIAWKQAFNPIQQDILTETSLIRVRARLGQLLEAVGIQEGQFNLQLALQIRRWRNDTNLQPKQAGELLNRQNGRWPRALKAVKAELTEIALLVELLASESNPEELANIKVNRLQPALDRMNRNIGLMEKLDINHNHFNLPSTRPLMLSLFGEDLPSNHQQPSTEAVEVDPATLTLTLQSAHLGLFKLLQEYQLQLQIQQHLLQRLNQRYAQDILALSHFAEVSANYLNRQNSDIDKSLNRYLQQGSGWVVVLLMAFVLLGWLISKRVRSQFEQLAILRDNNELILNSAAEGVIGLNQQGAHTFANPAAAAMLGSTPLQLVNASNLPFWHLDSNQKNPIVQLLEGDIERIHSEEAAFMRADGSVFPVEYSAMPIRRYQQTQGAVLTFMDITADKAAKVALEQSERQFRDLSEKSLVGVYIIQNHLFSYVNPCFANIFGYSRAEIENRLGPQDLAHPDDWPVVNENIAKRISGETDAIHYQIRALTKEKKLIHIELYGSSSVHRGAPAIVGTLLDVTERTRSEERIQYQAYYDQLTGLPNRTLFTNRLEHAIKTAHRKKTRLALLFLDLDRFKHINDSLGHQVGDVLLSSVAGRLNNLVRETDTVARLGGDEFTIIVENVTASHEPATVANHILEQMAQPFHLAGHDLFVSTSIGICLYPEDGQNAETLVKHADAAMYHAKNQGRSTFAFYTSALTASSTEWLELETDLRTALKQSQLSLHYQPQIDLRTDSIVGAEALLRWKHPQKGMISPAKFIPLAEETGLILEIGEWVITQACQQLRAWQQQGIQMRRLAVNLSAVQLERGELIDSIERILKDTGAKPEHLELEVTENSIMRNPKHCIKVLNKLRAMGISLSIDDFGTGYSSLKLLKELPINKLKIDQSFIADVHIDQDNEAITKAIISLANLLGLEVVAEGVETQAQLQFIRSNGCDLSQGYYHSPPISAEQITALLIDNKLAETLSNRGRQ